MQILRYWLFKSVDDHTSRPVPSCTSLISLSNNKSGPFTAQEEGGDLVIYIHAGFPSLKLHEGLDDCDDDEGERRSKTTTVTSLVSREGGKKWFHSTLHLRNLRRGFCKSRHFWHPGSSEIKMGLKTDYGGNVSCKVLPICDIASLGLNCGDGDDGSDKDSNKSEARRVVSRMKDLVRWAAATKSSKTGGSKRWKVLYFRNKIALKRSEDDSSSKISFRWDVASCSSSSSVYSQALSSVSSSVSKSESNSRAAKNNSFPSAMDSRSSKQGVSRPDSPRTNCRRNAQWITTDTEFVVLEL